MTSLVLNMTEFVLNITGLDLNMTGFVLNMNGFVLMFLFTLSTRVLLIFTYMCFFLYICKCDLFRIYILINLLYLNTYTTMKSNFHCCIEVKSFLSAPHLRATVKRLTQLFLTGTTFSQQKCGSHTLYCIFSSLSCTFNICQ